MEVETNETESQLPQFDKTLLEVQSLRTKFLNIKNASKGEEKEVALAIKTCNQLLKLYKEASEMFFKDESEMTQTPPSLNEKRNDTMKLRDKRSTSNETLKSKKRKRASSSATMTTTPTPTIITTTTSSSSSPLEDRAPYSPPTTKAKHVPVKNPARRTTTTGSTISTDATLGSDDEDELQPDRLVAAQIAKVKRPQQWILARVVRYLQDKNKYEVEDEDPGEDENNPVRKHYLLSPLHVIPLPKGDMNDPEYPKDSTVFAIFPNTTTFYTAIVVAPPKKKRNGEYLLKFFEDEDEHGITPTRKVPAAYVVHVPIKS